MKWELRIDCTILEETVGILKMKINAAEAIQQAMRYGDCDASTWADGLDYILYSLEDSVRELDKLCAKAIEEYRLEKEPKKQ